MKSFNRADYEKLMSMIDLSQVRTFDESYNDKTGINIRHDIDNDLQAALDMALLDAELGIRSTFFFLDTAPYWGSDQLGPTIEKIVALGHEIGWHNNMITRCYQVGECFAHDLTYLELGYLRKFYPVVGSASHGDPLCHEKKYINYQLFTDFEDRYAWTLVHPFSRFSMNHFKLKYEAYFTGQTHYLSEAGGKWSKDPESVIDDYKKNGGKLQILIHPQWWQL